MKGSFISSFVFFFVPHTSCIPENDSVGELTINYIKPQAMKSTSDENCILPTEQ